MPHHIPPTPKSVALDACRLESLRHIAKAVSESGVTLKQIALACDISIDYAAKLAASHTDPTQSRQLSYTHLMLLAQHIETREFARALMAPLLGIVDVQQLRVADLERMGQDYGSAAMETLERIKARLGLIPGAAVVMAPGLEMQVAANLNGEK